MAGTIQLIKQAFASVSNAAAGKLRFFADTTTARLAHRDEAGVETNYAIVGGSGDYTAADITNVPAGSIAAVNVQTALNELDTEKQPLDTLLTNIAALTFGADNYIYGTGSDTPAVGTVTAAARTLLAQTTQALMRTTGLGATAVGDAVFVAANVAAARTALVLGTAAVENIGTSGATVPLLSTNNLWTTTQNVGNDVTGLSAAGTGCSIGPNGTFYSWNAGFSLFGVRSGATANFGPMIALRRTGGTPAAPTQALSGYYLYRLTGGARTDTGTDVTASQQSTILRESATASAAGARGVFEMCPVGSVTLTESFRYVDTGVGIKTGADPSSKLHIGAGSATANTAPIQLTSGPVETTARSGLMEYDGNHYLTKSSNIRLGVGGALEMDNFASVGNVGTGVDTLYSETLLGNTLVLNGAAIRLSSGGVTTADAVDTRNITLTFGAVTVFASGALVTATAGEWSFWATIERDSSSSVRAVGQFSISGVGGATTVIPFAKLIAGVTLSSNQTILLTGESAGATVSDNDVVAYMLKGDYLPPGVL